VDFDIKLRIILMEEFYTEISDLGSLDWTLNERNHKFRDL
jgi:hypothetical protein